MTWIEIASLPWGELQYRTGQAANGVTATVKNLDGTNATTAADSTGASQNTSSLTADVNGTLPRFIQGGQYLLDVPALGVTGRRVEAVSGLVETGVALSSAQNRQVPRWDGTNGRFIWKDPLVFDVGDYGADPAGMTDSQPAFAAALVDALAAGRGKITGRHGWYYLATQGGSYGGLAWALTLRSDFVTVEFPRGTRIATRKADGTGGVDLSAFGVFGSAKPAGPASIGTYALGDATTNTYYAISSVAKGDKQITFTTPAQAANLAVGDWIYIRTGQLTASSVTEPDAEINRVRSVDSGTGIVTLEWATGAAYAQEYFISGTTGKTSTSVTANPATFGVAKITDRTVLNPRFVGFTLDTLSTSRSAIVGRGAIVNPYFDIRWECGGAPVDFIEHRGLRAPHWPVRMIAQSAGAQRFLITYDTGCSDGEIRDVDAIGVGRQLHVELHEGCKNCRVIGGRLLTEGGNNPTVDVPVEITSRARDFVIRDFRVDSLGSASPVYVDSTTDGGTLDNVQAFCTDATKGIAIEGQNTKVLRPDPSTVLVRRAPSGAASALVSGLRPQVPEVSQWLVGVIDFNNTANVPLGKLPANAIVTRIMVDVRTAFVSAGATTQRLNLGWSGGTNTLLTAAAAVDMSTVGPKKLDNSSTAYGTSAQIFSGTARDVLANYTTDGAAPTAGVALVLIEYVNVPKAI